MTNNLRRQFIGVLVAYIALLSPIAARSESTGASEGAQERKPIGMIPALEKRKAPTARQAPVVRAALAPQPSRSSRVFGFTASLGSSVLGKPLGGDYADFTAQYGGQGLKPAGSAFFAAELFIADWVSIFGETGFITYLGECGNCLQYMPGITGNAIIRQRMLPITMNVRFSLPFGDSSLYTNLGAGVAPGSWDWNLENGALLAVPLQAGVGYRHFFGSMFGLGLQTKYFYFINTSALHYAQGAESPSQRNLGILGIYLDVFFL